jgi:hypothetical protein
MPVRTVATTEALRLSKEQSGKIGYEHLVQTFPVDKTMSMEYMASIQKMRSTLFNNIKSQYTRMDSKMISFERTLDEEVGKTIINTDFLQGFRDMAHTVVLMVLYCSNNGQKIFSGFKPGKFDPLDPPTCLSNALAHLISK